MQLLRPSGFSRLRAKQKFDGRLLFSLLCCMMPSPSSQQQPTIKTKSKACALKRLVAAVALTCGAVWLKTGGVPKVANVLWLLAALLVIIEVGHRALEFETLEVIVINAVFMGLVNRLLSMV